MCRLSHPQIVRRVLTLIDHEDEPLSLSDLSRAIGASKRTIRNAFHDVYGLSPKRFLIRHKLEAVHAALLQVDHAPRAVTRAATEYGFFELGRFAGAYRRLFGELPSETVRHAQNGAHV